MSKKTAITDPNDPRLRGDDNTEHVVPKSVLRAKRFKCPAGCTVGTFVIRELTGRDELEASIWAEKNTPEAARSSAINLFAAEKREAMRLSLVEVDGQKVNQAGVPYMQMDGWSMKTMNFLMRAFNVLNGVDEDELKNCLADAEDVSVRSP